MRRAKTITFSILDKKAKAISARRDHIEFQIQAVREERAAAVRRLEESAQVGEVLAMLRGRAEGADEATQREIIRLVTRSVVVRKLGR